ncbi:MAG: tetratricopeptide repeat protein [Phycisphaerae bacterium]
MRKRASFLNFGKLSRVVFLALLFFCCSTSAQAQSDSRYSILDTRGSSSIEDRASGIENRKLFSSSVSQKFYEIAYELTSANSRLGEARRSPAVEPAIVFLTAAMKLDKNASDARSLLIKLACQDTEQPSFLLSQESRGGNLVYNLLMDYVDESADVEIAKKAVVYLLAHLNTREQREKLLEQMLGILGSKNAVFGSELSTLLGLLKAEAYSAEAASAAKAGKADLEAAEFYLMQAYQRNRYNKLAFAKLAELKPERIGPALYLERLRLALRENPSDIEAALTFAQQAEQLQLYETAAGVYEYCADLFTYLYPSLALPARIYLPWAISCYNTQSATGGSKCLQIAQRIQREGRFDLRVEAIAGKAATKIGNGELATQIFQAAEKKAQQLLMQASKVETLRDSSETLDSSDSEQVSTMQLAWFYCFVLPFPDKALDWANRAYETERNSPSAAAILAYALVMNNQTEWAKPLINNSQRSQIADLTLAQIQLAEGQKDLAIETLKTSIIKDPGSFAAERAKEILAQQGETYTPPIDPNAVLTMLENVFGRTLVPVFTPPENIFSVQLNIRGDPARREPGNEFPYGSEFGGNVAIINNSAEPFVISDDALFKGNIRIDADVSGDLNRTMPNLVSTKIRTALLIEPGRSILIPLRLITGELRKTLLTYPQASLDIEFTLYLDPVATDEGKITNRLTYLEPIRMRIKRPGIELTGNYIRSRLNLISKGSVGQKTKIAQLFIGLLKEQNEMLKRKPLYRYKYANWMEPLLSSALSGLLHNPANGQWVVTVHTMAEMLSLPLDYELISAVAKNLNDTNWPVRMMAVYLLSKTADRSFDKVLDWTAKNDASEIVRDMAIALGR